MRQVPFELQCARLAARIGLAFGLATVVAGCGRGLDRASVAEVDGQPIPLAELRRVVEGRFDADPNASAADVLSEELDRLVNQRVARNRATALGIEVSDGEVAARIRLVHGDDFEPDPVYREEVRQQMTVDRVAIRELAPRLRIPESGLADYFEAHKNEYAQPERIEIRQIVVEDRERAKKLRVKLREGSDFEQLAKDHSQAPEADVGGLLPPFARGDMPEVFDRAFDLQKGEVSDVIESPHGYHIFFVVERFPPQSPELADVREELMADLAREKLTELRPQWLRDLRRAADIRVKERLLETLKR